MNVVVLGGTSGMGRALARRMAERGDRLVLLGRDADGLGRSTHDLDVRSRDGYRATMAICDLERPDTFAPALALARRHLKGIDTVVVSAAAFGTQDQLEADVTLTARVLTTNFTNTILFCEQARKMLLEDGGGTLCVFSSVAGERGRSPVVLYGASKAGLTLYLEGLDHRYRLQGLRTVCVKPGFVTTSMTQGLRPPPFAGTPDGVAGRVLRAIDRGRPVVYVPPPWALVMAVIRHLPRYVMRRVRF